MKNFLLVLSLIVITNFNLFAVVPNKKDTNKDEGSRQIMEDNKIIFKLKSKIDLENGKQNKKQSAKNPNAITGIESVDKILNENKATNLVSKYGDLNLNSNKKIASIQSQNKKNELSKIYEITVPKDFKLFSTIDKLKKDPNVEYAQPKYIYRTLGEPNDMMYSLQNHLPQIKASQAWDVHKGEDGTEEILIGIHDSGVDWTHPDLFDNLYINWDEVTNMNVDLFIYNGERLVLNPDAIDGEDTDGNGYIDDVIGMNFVTDDGTEPNDPYGTGENSHGTHVAGLANARTNNEIGVSGVAYNVKFLATKQGGNYDYFDPGLYNLELGMIYMAEMGVDIINCSWGGQGYDYQLAEVFEYVQSMGCLIVAAAGNDGTYITTNIPAAYPGVIAVSSVNIEDSKAYYTTTSAFVDVAAPGGDFDYGIEGASLSTVPGGNYDYFQGTSMASPVTAGLVALMKSKEPTLTNEELTRRLIATTDDISTQVGSDYLDMGSGRINALNALTMPQLQVVNDLELAIFENMMTYDDNQNGVANNNENITMNVKVRNYAHFVSQNNVEFQLVSDNSGITLNGGNVVVNIPADNFFDIDNLNISIGRYVETGFYNVTLVPVNASFANNSKLNIEILVVNTSKPAIFVLTPNSTFGNPDASSALSVDYINEFYVNQGYTVITKDIAPNTDILMNFAACFMTLGQVDIDQNNQQNFFNFDLQSFANVANVLYYGGKVYAEGRIGRFVTFFFADGLQLFKESFGVDYLGRVVGLNVPVTDLKGVENTLLNPNTNFTASNEIGCFNSDIIVGDQDYGGTTFLTQYNEDFDSDFGKGVYSEGMFGQKSVMSVYALGSLVDATCPNHKEQLFYRISEFLDLDLVTPELCVDRPTRQTKNIRFRMIGKNRLGLTWTNGNGANRVVVASTSPLGDAEYLKDNTFYNPGNYGTNQSEVPGTFVTYVGNQARADINGLTNNTLYYCRVFEVNHNGMFNKYLLSSETGNPANRTTLRKESNEDEISESQFINVYPNPTTDFINIDLKVPFELENISIYDELGKEVYTSNSLDNNQIDVSSFSNGSYQIVINGQDQFIFNSFIILK